MLTPEMIAELAELGIEVIVMDPNDPKLPAKLHTSLAKALDEEYRKDVIEDKTSTFR